MIKCFNCGTLIKEGPIPGTYQCPACGEGVHNFNRIATTISIPTINEIYKFITNIDDKEKDLIENKIKPLFQQNGMLEDKIHLFASFYQTNEQTIICISNNSLTMYFVGQDELRIAHEWDEDLVLEMHEYLRKRPQYYFTHYKGTLASQYNFDGIWQYAVKNALEVFQWNWRNSPTDGTVLPFLPEYPSPYGGYIDITELQTRAIVDSKKITQAKETIQNTIEAFYTCAEDLCGHPVEKEKVTLFLTDGVSSFISMVPRDKDSGANFFLTVPLTDPAGKDRVKLMRKIGDYSNCGVWDDALVVQYEFWWEIVEDPQTLRFIYDLAQNCIAYYGSNEGKIVPPDQIINFTTKILIREINTLNNSNDASNNEDIERIYPITWNSLEITPEDQAILDENIAPEAVRKIKFTAPSQEEIIKWVGLKTIKPANKGRIPNQSPTNTRWQNDSANVPQRPRKQQINEEEDDDEDNNLPKRKKLKAWQIILLILVAGGVFLYPVIEFLIMYFMR